MNLKKRLVMSLTVVMVFILSITAQNMSYATTVAAGQEVYMGVTELMTNDTPNMGYAIGNPNSNTQGNTNAAKIWNIVKYRSSTSTEFDDGNIYCVKAGVGFTQTDANGALKRAAYNVFYDMKTERDAIKAQNQILKELVEKTITENGTTYNRYDALLAVLDMLYLPGESNVAQKTQLVENILQLAMTNSEYSKYSAYVELMGSYPLTDSDINAVQQAVIWYFTNNGEENGKYDKTEASSWLNYTLDGATYNNLANYTPNGLQQQYDAGQARSYQAEILYNYMIKTAKANASKYTNSTQESGAPAKVNTISLSGELSGDNYILGPINITQSSSIPYTINLNVKNNGNTVSNYKLLDENKAETTKTVKELVGKNFYISVPKLSVQNITVDLTVNYSQTTMKLWASTTNNQEQPLVEIKPENKTVPVQLTFRPQEPAKVFDLALRKYITKVNGVALSQSRVPVVEESTLASGTTATYKHRKNPVQIATGDVVTYKLTIYNEGGAAGRATKVIDQLPIGLKYKGIVSGNFELDSYSETDNTLKLKRKASNTDNLSAYTQGNLASETIEIECTVTAQPDTVNNKILTNVAWISEEFNAETNTTITNQSGADRDSEPLTKPNVNKDNMSDYTGNGNKNDLSDPNYYYKGGQDDDDFEKLVLLPEAFDLKLIKRITQVNNQNVPERIERVNVSKLNTLDANEKMITTAEYSLNKNAVPVKKGDIVTYTFRIYNEGTINGYAEEITEDIPDGLEFIWSEKTGAELDSDTTLTQAEKEAIKFNQDYLWGDFIYDTSREHIVKISSDYLSKEKETTVGGNLIQAFGRNDGTKTESDLKYKELAVKFKVVSENIGGTVIRNEACISDDSDKDGNPVEDRDSQPENWPGKDNNPNKEDEIYQDDEDYDRVILESFDLALRKFIIAVSSDTNIESSEYLKNSDGTYKRAPQVDTSKLNTIGTNGKQITTATYNHTKEPVGVKPNDIVVYMLRVYNEGQIDGYAAEIKDHMPANLEFVEGEFNTQYGWNADGRTVTTTYLANQKINKASTDTNGRIVLSYKEVPIMCKVKDTVKAGEKETNIADITKYLDENKKPVTDRDSAPINVELPNDTELPEYKDDETGAYVPGQEDDDDFEKVIIKSFDLALRKFIVAVKGNEDIKASDYMKNSDGTYTRAPKVDATKLNTIGTDGKLITTAIYNHSKEPVEVKKNDIVVYAIRVYNEGEIDGYASKITDHLPSNIEFVEGEFNDRYGWHTEDGRTVITDYLKNTKIRAAEAMFSVPEVQNPRYELHYADVLIMCRVKTTAKTGEKETNIADITEYLDEDKNPITDRDSQKDNVNLPDDENLPDYKDDEKGPYVPGQEDDDDFEKVIIKKFDLALRKFITKIENKDVTARIPQVKYEGGKISYVHPKDPLMVVTGNTVIYTIRVYNEGEIAGYAAEITDDIPAGLEFLPDNETNKTMRWKMIDKDGKETKDVSKAVKITTNYLSKEQEKEAKANLLKAFNPNAEISEENPDHRDVLVAFKVTEPNSSDKTIVNSAQISDDSDENGDPVEDEDSTPDKWVEGEDDQDKEYIKLAEFDLALRKWVTQAIVIENGKQTVTQTGHKPWDEPEAVVKVELHRKKINQVTVKFKYSIRVYNQGDIAGYAKEVTDYIPQGLKFDAKDNPDWKLKENNIITTTKLQNTLLKPGEYADVEVLLTWVNNENNMGVMTNLAEISKDDNEYKVPDKDSTPGNKKPKEDDIDDAPVMLSLKTGQVRIYFTLGFVVLITIAGGIVLIKKYVL